MSKAFRIVRQNERNKSDRQVHQHEGEQKTGEIWNLSEAVARGWIIEI